VLPITCLHLTSTQSKSANTQSIEEVNTKTQNFPPKSYFSGTL